jgi:hypothetical protein
LYEYKNGWSTSVTDDSGETFGNVYVTLKQGGWSDIIEGATGGLTADQMLKYADVILDGQSGKVSGKKGNPLREAVNKARNNTLGDGAIIDLNYGDGEYFVLYKGGRFYPVTVDEKTFKDSVLNKYFGK